MCQQFWKRILRFKAIELKIQQEMFYVLPIAAREAGIIVIF